ncbi:unannotated protein [freshwater metagenome]|uniref:Unannotated protein n=1 Tax=freshwater metagenome TaxID=449393 RepID=A0A6J6K9K8_9ZZZZ
MGEPTNVTSSDPCMGVTPTLPGTETFPVASVVPSYTRGEAVKAPEIVNTRLLMVAVVVAVVFPRT